MNSPLRDLNIGNDVNSSSQSTATTAVDYSPSIDQCIPEMVRKIRERYGRNSWFIASINNKDNRMDICENYHLDHNLDNFLEIYRRNIFFFFNNIKLFRPNEINFHNQNTSALSKEYSIIGPLEIELTAEEMKRFFEESKKINYKEIIKQLPKSNQVIKEIKEKRAKNANISD